MCKEFTAQNFIVQDCKSTVEKKCAANNAKALQPAWNPQEKIGNLMQPSTIHSILVSGIGYNFDSKWLHAGGPEDWIVNCPCGTRDDDGEAMVACDVCEVWMHTRCVDVPDDTESWLCTVCSKKK